MREEDIIERPAIGITTFRQMEEEWEMCFGKIGCKYVDAIYQSGGLPVPIPMIDNREEAWRYIEYIDGLVLTGGQDICPRCYREEPGDELIEVDLDRDRWELRLLEEALEADMPILGICRGMQLINVLMGGTLYQDLSDQVHMSGEGDYSYHEVEFVSGTHLSEILNDISCLNVNSRHHQAVRELGDGLKVAARDQSGYIEALEVENRDFVLGVQWHPENLVENQPCYKELFTALIEKASEYSRRTG